MSLLYALTCHDPADFDRRCVPRDCKISCPPTLLGIGMSNRCLGAVGSFGSYTVLGFAALEDCISILEPNGGTYSSSSASITNHIAIANRLGSEVESSVD